MRTSFRTYSAVLVAAAAALSACNRDVAAPDRPAASEVPLPAPPVALAWQEKAGGLIAANRLSALAAGRVYAALSVAQHRAIERVDGQAEAPVEPGAGLGPGGRSVFEARRGAVAGASAQVLGWFFPAAMATLEQMLADQASEGPGGPHPHFQQGVALGRSAGDAMILHVSTDGFTTPWTGTVPVGPGIWVPNALPPAGAMLGSVTPYFMASGGQFRPAPPPAFGSTAFATDRDEVLTLTQNITPAQLASARFWDFPAGTVTPIGYWNGAAAGYVAEYDLDERAATRVFALTHAAMFDALIGCWEAKYHYWFLRPSQAEPAIQLAFPVPNFPTYPSGHSCVSAAAGRVLTHFFPAEAAELRALVAEAGVSRILAGIHYRFDITAGTLLGRAAAELAISRGTP